jgi:HSP20 family molecular chaperone IbpA
VLLEAFDLGVDRLFHEINQRLGAQKTEFYEGRAVAEVEDNATRMRATELLADLHGVRKQSLDLNLGAQDGNELVLRLNRADASGPDQNEHGGD